MGKQREEIPVYLFAGFLDAGKTRFINNILADGFADGERTLLLCCEEGESEYESRLLKKNITVLTVEDEEDLTRSFLDECEKKYRPEQVLIEYNGMWPLQPLIEEILP
ncbi:MAG: GTP-binding protein, partial [Oscillospiraceae bacterium]